MASIERERLQSADSDGSGWRDWGPYVAERAWATVREDYSPEGAAWDYFPHDHARSRAYRWSEDGLGAICDLDQTWCLGLAFWNGADPILKDRLFGLGGPGGNHGEDAKELWWYLDSTPSHSWMRWRYLYPQRAYPYDELVSVNGQRSRLEPEYELIDTGAVDYGRYWLVTADFAKAAPHDMCIVVRLENCGPETATLDFLPTLWFRNTWAWDEHSGDRPVIRASSAGLLADHPMLGQLVLCGSDTPAQLFCDNESNLARLFGATNLTPFPKDGISDHVVSGAPTVNPALRGTKAAFRYTFTVAAGSSVQVRLRLSKGGGAPDLAENFTRVMQARAEEADAFYSELAGHDMSAADVAALRAAAGTLLWSKQFYHYAVGRWLDGDPSQPPPPAARNSGRNRKWRHFAASDIVVVPDSWEYPWPESTNLAVCAAGLAWLDPALAKKQLLLFASSRFAHPDGRLPAYEWSFGDLVLPIQAYVALQVFEIDGSWDLDFLARTLDALIPDFARWVTSVVIAVMNPYMASVATERDFAMGSIAEIINQAGGQTLGVDKLAWAGVYCVSLLALAIRLQEASAHDLRQIVLCLTEYADDLARSLQEDGWWDEEDGFFYDRITSESGEQIPVQAREILGFISVIATLREAGARGQLLQQACRDVTAGPAVALNDEFREDGQAIIGLTTPAQLARMLDHLSSEEELLCAFGLRSLSKYHRDEPLELGLAGAAQVSYVPGEALTRWFGGNTNFQGPVWPHVNWLIHRALAGLDAALASDDGNAPGGSTGDLADSPILLRCGVLAAEIRARLLGALRCDEMGHGIAFPEYVDAESGQGHGASHSAVTAAVFLDLLLRS